MGLIWLELLLLANKKCDVPGQRITEFVDLTTPITDHVVLQIKAFQFWKFHVTQLRQFVSTQLQIL